MHRVTKRCKEHGPCMNEENQNPTMCHPSHGISKCVYCCNTDNCNRQEIPSADDSASTIISTSDAATSTVALDSVTTVTSTVALSPVTDVTSTVTQDSTAAVKSTATLDPAASKYSSRNSMGAKVSRLHVKIYYISSCECNKVVSAF